MVGGDSQQQPVLLRGGERGDPGSQRLRIILYGRERRAPFGRGLQQFVIKPQEGGQGLLGSSERTEACRDGWLLLGLVLVVEGVLVAFPGSVGRQPGQIERPQVACCEFGTDPDDRRKAAVGVLLPVLLLRIAG